MKIPHQAMSVEALGSWVGLTDATNTIESLDSLFDSAAPRIGDLARRINAAHPDVGRGALYARLSRSLLAVHRHADYFRSASYPESLRQHLCAHRAFAVMLAALSGAAPTIDTGIDMIAVAVRDTAPAMGLPEFLAEALFDAAGRRPLYVPLALDIAALGAVVAGIYSRMCRHHGPVATDRMLTHAVATAASEVPGFDPRQFL